ncbi:MAG: arsenate reductase ArsC [Acholeplasmataceae bacterium]
MLKVLFVCIHNSARSQMAEAFLNDLGEGLFHAESAGIEAGSLNPYVVKVMQEIDYDLSENETNSVFDFFKEGRVYTYVVKVCDEASVQRCPIFPSALREFNWSITDPSTFSGSEIEILSQTRKVRDQIKLKVLSFIEEHRTFAKNRRDELEIK